MTRWTRALGAGAPGFVRFGVDGWEGWHAPDVTLALPGWLAAVAQGRRSRHARSVRIDDGASAAWVKHYPSPDGRRALRAFRMAGALVRADFGAPAPLVVGVRADEGLLVTREVAGTALATALAALPGEARRRKRALLAALGNEVARLHAAGFVHGDLVPPNLLLAGDRFVFLDNDRTRRLPGAIGARRNLVQLGRFVVPGVGLTDRVRVLRAYADARGLDRRRRHRLGWWVAHKVTARRCAIDHIAPEDAARAGFRELMRSGGRFDPTGGAHA
jgi:hypothetical protein